MKTTKLIETEVTINEISYSVDLELTAQIADASFSHGHGIETASEVEVTQAEVQTVYSSEGEVITSREIITQIENRIDIEDYNDQEFDFD